MFGVVGPWMWRGPHPPLLSSLTYAPLCPLYLPLYVGEPLWCPVLMRLSSLRLSSSMVEVSLCALCAQVLCERRQLFGVSSLYLVSWSLPWCI